MGGILIAVAESSSEWIGMDATWTKVLEVFVGVFMLGIGKYGLSKAFRDREHTLNHPSGEIAGDGMNMQSQMPGTLLENQEKMEEILNINLQDSIIHEMESCVDRNESEDEDKENQGVMDDKNRTIHRADPSLWMNKISEEGDLMPSTSSTLSSERIVTLPMIDPHVISSKTLIAKHSDDGTSDALGSKPTDAMPTYTHSHSPRCNLDRYRFFCSHGSLALAIGVVHGVAGPGGVLGVIPAVQLRDARLAFIYLGTFCITSTLSMGLFAAFYGTLSEWLAGGNWGRRECNRVFLVEVGSASLSIVVGFIWLVLLSVGKLEEVFP